MFFYVFKPLFMGSNVMTEAFDENQRIKTVT